MFHSTDYPALIIRSAFKTALDVTREIHPPRKSNRSPSTGEVDCTTVNLVLVPRGDVCFAVFAVVN